MFQGNLVKEVIIFIEVQFGWLMRFVLDLREYNILFVFEYIRLNVMLDRFYIFGINIFF